MSLAALKKQNSLDSLLGAAQKESAPKKRSLTLMNVSGNQSWISLVTDTQSFVFFPHQKVRICLIKVWNHAFQGPTGQWYIENSLTTVGQNDPVSEYNSKLWNSGVESDKEIARKQKRKLQYYSNVYIVEDPANPQNEGKVFLYRYGKKIFDKIMEAMHLHSKMKVLSIPLTSGKVRTSS